MISRSQPTRAVTGAPIPISTRDMTLLISTTLREIRVRAGMTQSDVAQIAGLQRPVVSRIEKGLHEQSLETIRRYTGACGARLSEVTIVLDRALGLVGKLDQ